jgi:hypothetical protein
MDPARKNWRSVTHLGAGVPSGSGRSVFCGMGGKPTSLGDSGRHLPPSPAPKPSRFPSPDLTTPPPISAKITFDSMAGWMYSFLHV